MRHITRIWFVTCPRMLKSFIKAKLCWSQSLSLRWMGKKAVQESFLFLCYLFNFISWLCCVLVTAEWCNEKPNDEGVVSCATFATIVRVRQARTQFECNRNCVFHCDVWDVALVSVVLFLFDTSPLHRHLYVLMHDYWNHGRKRLSALLLWQRWRFFCGTKTWKE